MILTEEEARTKWCPETLIGAGAKDDTSRANRWIQPNADGGPVVAGAGCIGGACMAWRWFIGIDRITGRTILYTDRTGYCGKAGKP